MHWVGQSSVSWRSNMSQMSQNIRGASLRLPLKEKIRETIIAPSALLISMADIAYGTSTQDHEIHETCHSVTLCFMKKLILKH